MAILSPTKVYNWNGLKVNEYLLTTNNPNKISMPTIALVQPIGITVHNTPAIKVASNTTMAEQYTRATVNGNMNTVRVHFYVDDYCAWQNLPLTLSGWHAADGKGMGNTKTIAIEIIGNTKKAEENGAKLVAYLLNKYNWNVDENVYTHTHWLNVKDGKTGTIDELNIMKNSYKMCPSYILPHWNDFKNLVKSKQKSETITIYRIRKNWDDEKSQIGAYSNLENAKKACKEGYSVFDESGKAIYSIPEKPVEKPAEKPVEKPVEKPIVTPAVTPAPQKVDVIYRVYSNKKWWSEIKNYNNTDSNGYAGVETKSIKGIAIRSGKGTVKYRVHIKGGSWLGWMTGYDINNWRTGCAGNKIKDIDAIQMDLVGLDGYEIKYRVSTVNSKNFLNWIEGYNTKNSMGYAGTFGRAIDKVQIEIIKK